MGLFNKIKNIFLKEQEESELENDVNSIIISTDNPNTSSFDEVVKMFCDELHKQLAIKINPKDFIKKSSYDNNKKTLTRFTLHIPAKLSDEEILLFNIIKKNVQLKIKGNNKYKNINLVGIKKRFIDESEIKKLWKIIENDEQFNNFDGTLVLNVKIRFFTCVYDFDRFVDFVKKLNKFLDFKGVDYVDVKKRITNAVNEISDGMYEKVSNELSEKTKFTKLQMRESTAQLGEQGAVKLIYVQSFSLPIFKLEGLNKKAASAFQNLSPLMKNPTTYVENLSTLTEFMQQTLESEGYHKDFLFSIFELSNDWDIDCPMSYGCYATMNDKTGLDESIFRLELPEQ